MDNGKKCIQEALDSLNIRRESRKFILKEEQERAVKELISGNDVLATLPMGFWQKHGLQTFTRFLPWRTKNAISEDLRPGYLPT